MTTPKPTQIEYCQTKQFARDLKQLLKRFRTLESDLKTAQQSNISVHHLPDKQDFLRGASNQSIFQLSGCSTDEVQIYKVKKFRCRAIGRGVRSGIRLIYAFHTKTYKVEFIQMYHKSDTELEDRGRIAEYMKSQGA